MTTLPDMAGTPRVVEIRGKEYRLSPFDIDDLAEFETIVRRERNKALLEALEGSKLRDSVITEAIGVTASRPVSLADIDKHMGSMMGVRFLLWCSLKKNHPEMKLEEMGKLIDLDNFEDAAKIVSELGGKAVKEGKNARRGPTKK